MELKFMTPTEVWEGFDAHNAPLEASIISSQTTDNLVCVHHVFTSETTRENRVRIDCRICYDARWQDPRPAVLALSSFDSSLSSRDMRALVEEGFVVCAPDYCGVAPETRTSFPSDLSFAAYPECKSHLDDIESTARNTPWFVWTKIARRAISLLEEQSIIQKDRIGIVGFGIGAQLCWLVAGTDSRVRAMVAINGGGYRWADNNAKFLGSDIPTSDKQLAYSTGIGAETYARFITCPTLAIVTRDSTYCDIDRIGDMLEPVKAQAKQLIVSVSCGKQLTKSTYEAMILWLRDNLAHSDLNPVRPSIHFETTDGKLYVRICTGIKASSRKLYISYGEPSSKQRYWQEIEIRQKVGEHEYVCNVPVYDTEELLVAYATFAYPDGNIISTKTISIIPSKHDITDAETSPRNSNIIYDGNKNIGVFIPITDGTLVDEESVTRTEGPFGIIGVSMGKGNLRLGRSMQEMLSTSRSAVLHIDAYSKSARTLQVALYTYPDLKRYTARTELKGGEFWQKLLFENTDFKSDEGRALASFANVKTIELIDVDSVVLNNFLWI